jgi:hypothetical protein
MAANHRLSYTALRHVEIFLSRSHELSERSEAMASDAKKVNRILVMKIKLPAPEAFQSLSMMMKSVSPFYKALGDGKIRLLRNVDSPSELIQIVEYEAEQTLELNRQRLASDPTTRNFVQAWRMLFPGGIEIDVYEDVTEKA